MYQYISMNTKVDTPYNHQAYNYNLQHLEWPKEKLTSNVFPRSHTSSHSNHPELRSEKEEKKMSSV